MIFQIVDFFIVKIFGKISWAGLKYFFTGSEYDLSDGQIDRVTTLLQNGRYVVLTRRDSHLSTYMVSLAHWLLTLKKDSRPKFARWSHVLMHIESGLNLDIIESAGRGVQRVSFYRALCVDHICVLKPKYLNNDQMEQVNELAKSYIGTLYDSTFDLHNDNRISCVELIYRTIMRVSPGALPNLNAMILKYGNLTPQMFYDCGDFEIVLEMKGVKNDFSINRN